MLSFANSRYKKMKYKKIIENIKVFDHQELTIDTLHFAQKINHDMNKLLISEMSSGKINALIRYREVKALFDETLFNRLKETTTFEDEVIYKIMTLVNRMTELLDIIVVDGEVIIKEKSINDFSNNEMSTLVSGDSLFEINNISFNNTTDLDFLREFIITSLNNVLKPLINMDDEPLLISNSNILYNHPKLNIYFNRSLNEINNLMLKNNDDITRIVVKYEDDVYTFDMKIRNGYLILSKNDFPVWKFSEMNKKEKTYTK